MSKAKEVVSPEKKLSEAISKVVCEHMGWKIGAPSKKESKILDDAIAQHKAGRFKTHPWTGKIE